MNLSDTRTRHFALAIVIISLYILPLILLGENAYLRIRENLTSGAIYPKLIIDSGTAFASSDTIVPQLNLPRLVLGSEFNLLVLLYRILPTIDAYIIGFSITRIIAFMGMYLLLKRHFLTDDTNDYITVMVSMCFALLPFLFYTGLSIAGQPLALYSFLNFRKRKQTIKDWLVLIGIPFYSSFFLSFFFFLIMAGCIWLYDFIKKRDPNLSFILAIAIMTMVFVFVEYRLFRFMVDPFFVSHRHEFGRQYEFYLTPFESLKLTLKNIFIGQFHARGLQSLSIGISLVSALLLAIHGKKMNTRILREILILTGAIISIAILKGILHSDIFLRLCDSLPLVKEFNFSRFYWLQPLMWHIVFALSLVIIVTVMQNRGKIIMYGLIALQVLFCFYMSDFNREMIRTHISYKNFFAEKQFREIKEYIGEPPESYRVISIGMYPSIALFNGFHTADFYLSNYPLEYKHRFRRIIEKELDKVPAERINYDEWGNMVYALSSEMRSWDNSTPIRHLEYNIEAMKELGIRYVLSRVPIENQFIFMKYFSHPESVWDIYLYKVSAD